MTQYIEIKNSNRQVVSSTVITPNIVQIQEKNVSVSHEVLASQIEKQVFSNGPIVINAGSDLARTPKTEFICFLQADTPITRSYIDLKGLDITNIHAIKLVYVWAASGTDTPNVTVISPETFRLPETSFNYTGSFSIAATSLPTPIVIADCITIGGNNVINATTNNFASVETGQAVSGVGIPAGAYIQWVNTAKTQIKLCAENGTTPVEAIASGSVSLTISGAVILLTTWV
jgi:hypothetical protein